MGIRYLLHSKWGSSSSPFLSNPSPRPTSVRSKDVSYESERAFILSIAPEDTLCKDSFKSCQTSFGALEVVETGSQDMKVKLDRGLPRALYSQTDNMQRLNQDYTSISCQGLEVKEKSRFSLLLKNLEKIEEIFIDEDFKMLERDIMIQLGKLGALQLFHTFLSRSFKTPTAIDFATQVTKHSRNLSMEAEIDGQPSTSIVRSRKKEGRKLRRGQITDKADLISSVTPSSKSLSKFPWQTVGSTVRISSRSRSRRFKIARSEAEMSRRVKDVADLENIRINLEGESGQLISFQKWAEAVGVDEKALQQRLHYGWFCRDKLLKSTHSLVVFIARNYHGHGISVEELYQAGKVGVLKGAERFDHTRGYQFSTYVHYWIRKEMSILVEQRSREIQIPVALRRRIDQIKRARRALYNLHGRYPDDDEIARFSGLSIAKIISASKYPRIVGSVDQRMGDDLKAKIREFTADPSIKPPEEVVMRKHLQKDIYELLQGLHPRERQVLVLRYGFWDGQCKSLEEIARIFKCTKEWIRKVEKSALTKLRKEEVHRKLSQYLSLQF